MKLYDVPRNTRIKIEDQELLFHKIDGMYSVCTDSNGCIHHLAAWTEVEVLDKEKQMQLKGDLE